MPIMSGEESFRELQRMRPNTPVLLSSGFSEEQEKSFRAFPIASASSEASYRDVYIVRRGRLYTTLGAR